MNVYLPKTLRELFEHSTKEYAERKFTSYADGSVSYTYGQYREQTLAVSKLMSCYGVGTGDKVIILSENMPNYSVVMFAATAFGRVMVPVLPDSSANEVNNIIVHSEAKAIFASTLQLKKISDENLDRLQLVVNLGSLELVKGAQAQEEPELSVPEPDDLAAILYTSGTSGDAKGVMLTHRNLCHNLVGLPDVFPCTPEHVLLSILPIAHTYEMSIGLLYPMTYGASIYYLSKAPTPSVLMVGLKQVRPMAMCSVPLIIEKIYRKSVLRTISISPLLMWMQRHTPSLLYRIIGSKLKKTFGGRLEVVAIGGAKLDPEVEIFLQRAHFPYIIGYGLTETAPLIAATTLKELPKVGSTGPIVKGVQGRIINPDPQTGRGELVVKGPNVMKGYYKDPERTAEAFTEDGWFRTKDLAVIDKKGCVSITGRLGNMILGASGENIYPEEIEVVINNLEGVEESIVKSEQGRLVAIVKLVDGLIDWANESDAAVKQKIEKVQNDIKNATNLAVNKASQLSAVRFIREPFVKTATQKIRRFLY